jgi:YggT family protein
VNVAGSAAGAVFDAILWLLTGLQWIVIIAALVSWVNPDPRNPIVRFLYAATEPPLRLIRRLLPTSLRYFPLDVAFLVLFGLVIFAQYGVVQSLVDYASVLRLRALQPSFEG